MNSPILSVIVATFQSSRTLRKVLESVRRQSGFALGELEILVVDGGSTDGTLALAEEYACRLIVNPRTEPVHGKFLGLKAARGKYVVYLDHDEVLINDDGFRRKLAFVQNNPNLRAVIGSGYRNPRGYPVLNRYINDFGEPFSYFVYRLAKEETQFLAEMKKKFSIFSENEDGTVFDFANSKSLPLIELCAAGSMIDRNFFDELLKLRGSNPLDIPHLFYLMQSETNFLGIMKDDAIEHHSVETFAAYAKKIDWRIRNNIYYRGTLGQAGLSGRMRYASVFQRVRSYLFLPYSLTILGPTFDAVRLACRNRSLAYFAHVPLAFYTGLTILRHSAEKAIGRRPALRSYDGSKKISGVLNPPLRFFLGTAAELIKCYPVIAELYRRGVAVEVISSGQAPDSFKRQWQEFFPEYNFREFSQRPQDLGKVFSAIAWFMKSLAHGLVDRSWKRTIRGARWIIQGDTINSLLGALLGKIHGAEEVVHLEAGRRSGNLLRPFPEEICRRLISRIADRHLCEDEACVRNLRQENIVKNVFHTFGNTQSLAVAKREGKGAGTAWRGPYCVVNLHRYENLTFHWRDILSVARRCAQERIVYFTCHYHVRERFTVPELIELSAEGIKILPRLTFLSFLELLEGADFLVTDSSGNQDDAAVLGVPTLVLREEVESDRGMEGPCVLAGWDWEKIELFLQRFAELRRSEEAYNGKTLPAILGALGVSGDECSEREISFEFRTSL